MKRFVLAAILGVAAFTIAGLASTNAIAEDKKKEDKKATTLEGTLTCTKCALSETKACGHALIVKDGDKKVNYYLVDKGGKEPYHKNCCTADVAGVKVTGTVGEKDGKKTITDPKVELPK